MQKKAQKTYEISGAKRIVAAFMLSVFISTVSPFWVYAEKSEKNRGNIKTSESEEKTEVLISAKDGGTVVLGNASIEIAEGALKEDTKISITHLRKVKDTGQSLYNAIPKSGGYRFLPKGTKFAKEAVVTLPYSKELNEKPQSLEELYTYFYDTEKECWVKLERLEIDKEKCLVRSLTTHFTDMINATLTLPESASPVDVNLNSIKNLEAAKADSQLIKFNAPKATSQGDATFSFELKIPSGRKGVQPQITVNYSSGGGNGIMGKGFDVYYGSSVSTDTRLGVPKYATRDAYMLDGILLDETERRGTTIRYRPQKESAFSRIVRYGAGTEKDYWEVTEKSGTKRTYAQSAASCVGSGKATFTWNITKIQDANGNNVEYEYIKDSGYVYPAAIYYTGFGGKKGNYSVRFHYDENGMQRQDVRIDARSKELVSCKKVLTSITTHYKDGGAIRTYSFAYTEGIAKEKMMTTVRFSNNADERYEYTFKYNEAEKDESGKLIYFAEAKEWKNGKALQVGNSTSIGSNFNASAGLGYGTRFIDVRGTGGGSGSVSAGESYTEETMADINGDGRPDAISQEGNTIYVSLNNGNGFEKKQAITILEGSFSGEIDKEKNTSSTVGWNVYGGAGIKASKISISAGAGYSEVYQNTSSSVLSSFMDVNQDGLVDIVESGKKYYLKNSGNLKFTKAEILSESIIKDVSQELTLDEKNEYQKTYFVQNPFRVWKAPYEGFITIEEKTKGLSENLRSNIKAKTLIGDKIENEKKVISGGTESKKSYTTEKDKNIYFITDFGNEPKNTDIEWNVNIEYSEIKSLKKDFKSVIFVPEELPPKKVYSNQKSKEDAEKEFEKTLGNPLLIELYEVSSEKKQEADGNESYKVTFEYSDKWKSSENLLGICGALIKTGYFMPTTFTKEEFSEYLSETDKTAGKKQEPEKIDYYKKFSSQFVHKAAEDIFIIKPFEKNEDKKDFYKDYPISGKLKEKCMQKYNIEGVKTYFTDTDFLYGNSKTYPVETGKRNENEIGTIFEKDGKVLYNIGSIKTENQSVPVFYNATDKKLECAEGIFSGANVTKLKENAEGNQLGFSVFYNYDKNGKAESEIKFNAEEISYRPENMTALEFQRIFDSINVEHTDVYEKHWNWEKEKIVKEAETESLFAGMSLSADEKSRIIKALYGEKKEKYDEENKNTEYYYYTIKENPDYKAAQEILTAYKKRVVTEEEFPFYEEQADGGYEIKDFWRTEKTESEISDLYKEETGNSSSGKKYEEYKTLNSKLLKICKSHNLGKVGKISCAVEYEKEHLYKVENNRHNQSGFYSMLQLDADENGGISFFTKHSEPFKTIWNSKNDYDTENVTEKICVYEYEITEEIEGEEYSGTDFICINNDEFLYGGKNNWFYGIWKSIWQEAADGSFTEINPFSEENLMAFESGATEINSEDEFKKKAEEAEKINTEAPKKEESETKVYFYLPVTKEESQQVKEAENLENAETGYLSGSVEYDKALLGTVCVNTFLEKDKNGKKNPVTEYYMPFIYGDTIHADRAGGVSYYTIEGLYAQDNSTSEIQQESITIPTIRKTYTKGTDKTPNISVSLGGSAADTVSKLDDVGKVHEYATRIATNGFTGSTSKGTNESKSEIKQAFQDINGDGIPDIIQVDSKKSKVNALLSSGVQDGRVLYSEQTELENISVLGKSSSKIDVYGGSVSPGGNISVTPSGLKKMSLKTEQKASANPSGGITYSKGENFQSAGFSDINGDGLCDYYDGGSYRLNSGGKFVLSAGNFSGTGNLYNGNSQTFGMNFSIGKGANLLQANSLSSGASVNLGLTYSFSSSNTEKIMLDINGDGLSDVLEMTTGDTEISVRYNTGCGFTDKQSVKLPGWGKIIEENSNKFLTQADSSGYDLGFVDDIPVVGTMLKGSLGAVSVNPFGFLAEEKANSLDWSSSTTLGFSGNVGANVNIGFDIWVLFVYCGTINVTVSGGAGANASTTINGATVKMLDLDGDGLADQVLRIPGFGTYWKQNISGRYGQLTGINLPQGGNVQLEYTEQYGTPDNPIFKYVLSEVVVNDGCGKTVPKIEHGEHSITTKYEYADGYYDRKKHDFYGYGTVRTIFADGTYTVDEYYNRDYYLKGALEKSTMYASDESVLSMHTVEYCDTPYALPYVEESWNYEKASGANAIHTMISYEYDDFGNCTKIIQDFGGGESLTGVIEYDNANTAEYIVGLPTEIYVCGTDGKLLRRRSGRYDDKGQLTELRQYFNSYNWSSNFLSYDNFGNIKSVCDSRGAMLSYVYDSNENMFVTEIAQHGKGTDTYKTTLAYDVATQTKTSESDCNGNTLRYEYDNWQRITKIFTSYDNGEMPSVSYEYYAPEKTADSDKKLWYSVTNNKVTFNANDDSVIQTVLQIDGLGRAVRTAKTGFVNGALGWNASGAVEYDSKGRTKKEGMTEFIEGGLESLLNSKPKMTDLFTSYEYDEKDRQVKTVLPDNSVQENSFYIEENNLVSESTDPLGNVSVQESDSRGNIVRVARFDKNGAQLTQVTYRYNALGEMLKAFDAKGNPISAEYDLLGRRIALESLDSDRQEFFYDECSNLVRENNSVLRGNNKQILYEYDGLNRLVRIDYPNTEDTAYTYGGANDKNGAAGKILSVTDASGTLEYEYGKLGEVTKETRTLSTHLNGIKPTETSVMEYCSDYLGRMQYIVYPDGEKITYGYDKGGQVISVTGEHYGHKFNYVTNILYDEYGQRTHIEYGNGTFTEYSYDPARRWLDTIKTENKWGKTYQNIAYSFDAVGNVLGYENDCLDSVTGNYKTKQTYSYDNLYQLIKVDGSTMYNPYASSVPEFVSDYSQAFTFDADGLGNMTSKVSTETVSPQKSIGDNLNYNFDYVYDENYAHRLINAGERYYQYDANGNITVEQDGSFEGNGEDVSYHKITQEADGVYSTDYGWGLFAEDNANAGSGSSGGSRQRYKRTYTWNERNQLVSSVDSNYSTVYIYGQDGQRSNKYTQSSETLYFNKMWTLHTDSGNSVYGGQFAKNIYLGETRIVTKLNSGENSTYQEEYYKQYFYHSDHLGSASLISDYKGDEYQRIEYTPYGETWVEKTQNTGLEYLPYKFTGKEIDEETGLYYYGARYLDPKYSRWISTDPALSDYIPVAPVSNEVRQYNSNLPGMGGVFNHINGNLYHYAGNNPIKYIDPDGRVAQFVIGAITGFISSAAINFGGQVISGLVHGKSLKESVTTVDVATVVTTGLGGAVTGAITGGLGSVKAIKDVMTISKTINGIVNSSANVAGTVVSTVANNALHEEDLDKGLGLNVGLAIGAGVVSGLTSPGANKVIEYENGVIKESFVKLSAIDESRTITTIKQVSSDNAVKEVFISAGQELAGKLVE